MLLSLLTLALADEPAPVPGLADLHLHQWAEYNYAGEFYAGKADGPASVALAPCGLAFGNGWRGQLPPTTKHGQLGGLRPGNAALMTHLGLTSNANDDSRRHPPFAWSDRDEYPPFLGWPTSDSVAHQQAWTGWLRLAHDGAPMRWYFENVLRADGYEHGEISTRDAWLGMRSFYDDYAGNMKDAFAAGHAGLNLVVTSLVASANGCRGIISRQRREQDPDVCYEPNLLRRQYDAAVSWARRNRDWAEIVTSPVQAEEVIRGGRLAVVLSLESSDVLREYVHRLEAEHGSDATLWTDAQVREALLAELQRFDKVSTLGIVHQLDNPFGGGAVVSTDLVAINRQRLANSAPSRSEELDTLLDPALLSSPFIAPIPGERRDAARDANLYAREWYWRTLGNAALSAIQLRTLTHAATPRRAVTNYASNSWGADRGVSQARPGDPASPGGPVIPRNRYGLSHHGQLLLEVLAEQGMPVDYSHASDALVEDTRALLAEGWRSEVPRPRIYLSHAYPREIDATPNELHASLATVAWVAESGGVVGVRPGDDFILTRNLDPKFPALAERLRSTNCQGTSVGALAYAATLRHAARLVSRGVRDTPTALAFGTDLNGFINQPGGTAGPRVPYDRTPCGTVAANVGSEVGTRGLAHIGLLPPLYAEMAETVRLGRLVEPGTPEARDLEDTITSLSGGAEAYLRVWRAAWTGKGLDEVLPAAPGPHTLPIPLTRDDHDPQLEVRLPFYRAIEGLLPYLVTADRGSPVLLLPQLPTNLGLLVGWKTWGMQRPRDIWEPERKRCVNAWGESACSDLRAVEDAAERGWRRGSIRDRSWGFRWNREFLGDAEDFGEWLVRQRSVPTANHSGAINVTLAEVTARTQRWLGEKDSADTAHLACLDDRTFAEAPVPTLLTGDDHWLRCRLWDPTHRGQCNGYEVPSDWEWHEGRSLLPDGSGRSVSCYCDLLADLAQDEALCASLTERDRYLLALCSESRDHRYQRSRTTAPQAAALGRFACFSANADQVSLVAPRSSPLNPEFPATWPEDSASADRLMPAAW